MKSVRALEPRIPDQGPSGQYGWRTMAEQQAQIDARIDTALRDRTLTIRDAAQLRADFQTILRLESQYRQGGVSQAEQADLDRRLEALNGRIPGQGPYGQYDQYGWKGISQRQPAVEARIDAALRNRTLSTWDAARLRAEFSEMMRLEGQYSQGGLSSAERADLDRRFDALSARIPGGAAY